MAAKKGSVAQKKEEQTFTKEQLVNSKQFCNRKDALAVVLRDGEKVSIKEATKRLDEFMKRKVN